MHESTMFRVAQLCVLALDLGVATPHFTNEETEA